MSADPSSSILAEDALRRIFASLEDAEAVLLAVSGGPDSIALMHMVARWAAAPGRPAVLTSTVDHGLRPESSREASWVGEEAFRLGLDHQVLAWSGPKPETRLQEAAREARYRLLVDRARRCGASHLVTAHTQDDQAETVLMRLARGTGPAGLAGMRPLVMRGGIRHVRPLLGMPKAALVGLCETQGWTFVRDASNSDDRFARVRWRKLLPVLAGEGLTPDRLALVAERARRADEALEVKAGEAFARAMPESGPGGLRLGGSVLIEEPFEIAVRVLALALARCREEGRHLRLDRLEACTERLRGALGHKTKVRMTLAGALVLLDRDGNLHVSIEQERRRGRYRSVRDDAAAAPHSLGKGRRHA